MATRLERGAEREGQRAAERRMRRASLESGTPIGAVTGTGTWELPMPAAIVIDQSARVGFADVSPDWLVRAGPLDILAAVRDIIRAAAA